MKNVVYDSVFKTPYGLEFMLKDKSYVDTQIDYDRTVAYCHVRNVGCVVAFPDGEVMDNEYDLDCIYKMIEDGECSVVLNKYWTFNYGNGRIEDILLSDKEYNEIVNEGYTIFKTCEEALQFSLDYDL